jgi:ABC-type branched-subunit amino acid transport system ATPase component
MRSNGPLLEARALTAFYGDFQALFDIDFRIERNETVAIIGSNGAGKIHPFEKHHRPGSG